ncbi:MAG TPA: tRNA pseudouridine(38-40) synthase TruA [Candidatus Aminicenantes bacterium]|nr:tRNA pseudouridine(38-40) synthase TruA [Candidatus Aminicenantes bacterium]
MKPENYRVTLEFDGTSYSGWQYQNPETPTIQREIMRVLQVIAKKRVVVTGSSRTDAGVHSRGLVANFHLPVRIQPDSLQLAMNALLPRDIRVSTCERAHPKFNARFGACSKTYEYRIFRGRTLSPFDCRWVTHIPQPLDIRAMKRALRHFKGSKDYSSFTSDTEKKNRVRTINRISLKKRGDTLILTVTGPAFLRYMVRNIAGTLIDVGRGKIEAADIPAIFAARDRRRSGRTAPARGLTLQRVDY